MKRWRSVKMMMLALVALFIPALAMPALCCASNSAPSQDRVAPNFMACCVRKARVVSSAAVQCPMHNTVPEQAAHNCCSRQSRKAPHPSPDLNLPTASARSAAAQAEQNRAAFGPQYLTTIVTFAPPVLRPLPQTSERNFESISPLSSLDKSPPAPGRAPPVL